MIGMLTGLVAEKNFSSCIIDVHGVGYEVAIPLSTFDRLPLEGSEAKLYIHTAVREDAITLFGFATPEEKKLFQQLIQVSGVGGKLALNVLSAMPAASFCAAVSAEDVKALSRINGVGKRTAERLIVELRDKLVNILHRHAVLRRLHPLVRQAVKSLNGFFLLPRALFLFAQGFLPVALLGLLFLDLCGISGRRLSV